MSELRSQGQRRRSLSRSASKSRRKLVAAALPIIGLGAARMAAANTEYTWELVSGTPGGSGNWSKSATDWNSGSGLVTWTSSSSNDAVFTGTAGTVTLQSAKTAGTAFFNSSGYTLATTNSNEVLTANVQLAANVNLNFFTANSNSNNSTYWNNFTIVGNVTGTTGSTITMQGTPAGGSAGTLFNEVDFSGGKSISVPIIISGNDTTGTGAIGIAATNGTAGVVTVNDSITNNSSNDLTELGATSGYTLDVLGVVGGSQGVLVAQGSAGGKGIVQFGAANTYAGSTTLNMSSAGILQLTTANALPDTALVIGYTSGEGGIVDLDGQTVTVASLGNGSGGAGQIYNSNTSSAATLIINGSGNGTFALPINNGPTGSAGTVALTINQSGSTTLTGSSGYTGATAISAGTLTLSGNGQINSTSGITVSGSSAKFVQLASTAVSPTVSLNQGTIDGTGTINIVNVGPGGSTVIQAGNGSAGTLTIGNLGFAGAATFDLTSTQLVAVSSLLSFGGSVTLNASAVNWANGQTYNLITYGSVDNLSDVSAGSLHVSGLSSRQSATLETGTPDYIGFLVQGDSPEWTGATNGFWDTTTTNWQLITAGTPTAYINTSGSADTVLFNDAGLAVGGATTITFAGSVNPAGVTFNNSSNNYTLAASSSGYGITGATSLIKAGSAALVINNTNSYTGGTILSGGTIQLGATNALPTASDTLTFAAPGVSLDLAGNNQTLTEIADTSSNTGSIILGGGTLSVGADNASTTLYSAISDTGGSVSSPGAGSLIKTGTGTLTLANAETYGGSTIISAGTVALAASAGSLNSSSNLVINGGKFQLNGNAQTVAELSGTGGQLSINSAGATLTVGEANTTTFAGSVTGSGGLVKNGAGTLNLTGAVSYGSTNSYGGTTVNNGTLNLAGSGMYVGLATVNSGGTLEFSQNTSAITTFSGSNVSVAAGGNLELAPAGAGAIALTNDSSAFAGNIVLATAMTINVQMSGGSLSTTNVGGGGQILVNATGSLITNPSGGTFGGAIANNIVFYGTSAGSVANGGGYTPGNLMTTIGGTTAGYGLSLNGNISGTGDLTIGNTLGSAGGAGTLIINGSNSYSGATLIDMKGGTIQLGSNNALPSTTDVVVGNETGVTTPTLDLHGYSAQINSLSDGANLSSGVLTITNNAASTTGTLTISGSTTPANGTSAAFKDGSGTLALVKGGSSTLVLTSTSNTYSGGTTINGGAIFANGSTSALGTGPVTVNMGATLGGKGTINNGTNNITIESGGTLAAGSSAATNGILTTGAQSWQGGGNYLWKINAAGTGGVAAGSGSSGSNGLSVGSGTPGASWDQVTLTQALDITNAGQAAPFTLTPTGTLTNVSGQYSWIIAQAPSVNFPSGISNGTDLLTTVPGGGATDAFALNTNGLSINGSQPSPTDPDFVLSFQSIGGNEDLVLDYDATPEPGTVMLVLGGVAPMLMGRRRRRQQSK